MAKVYIVCYKCANEIEDIQICLTYEAAIEELSKYKKTRQVLEYDVINDLSTDTPVCEYYYENGELIARRLK